MSLLGAVALAAGFLSIASIFKQKPRHRQPTKAAVKASAPNPADPAPPEAPGRIRPTRTIDPWGKPSDLVAPVPTTSIQAETPAAAPPRLAYEKEIVNEEWTLRSGERVLVDNIAVNVRIRYRNWSHETDRSVTVQAIIGRNHRDGEVSVTSIGGYCQLRRATRQFHLQNIVFCVDPVTGEIIAALGEWIMRQAGRAETVRPLDPAWNEGPEAREVEPTVVELELDLSRGRGQAVERFTVEIYATAGWGHAFEGMATRHKAAGVRAWKGRKRFQVGPDGSIRLSWMEHDGKRIDDIAAWLAALPNASVSTRTPPLAESPRKPR